MKTPSDLKGGRRPHPGIGTGAGFVIIGSLQLAHALPSFAADFVGSGDGTTTGQTTGSGYDSALSPVPQSPVYENFYGGRVTGTSPAKAEDNKLMLTGQHELNVSHQRIYGGFAQNGQSTAGGISAQASANSVLLDNVFVQQDQAEVYGGYAKAVDGEARAAQNTVVLQGGAFREDDHLEVYGGRAEQAAGTASALQNHVVLESVSNRDFHMWLAAGHAFASSGTASAGRNTLSVKNEHGTTIVQAVHGGMAQAASGRAEACGNTGTLSDISFEEGHNEFGGGYDWVYQGEAQAGSNAFTLSGRSFAKVYGGWAVVTGGGAGQARAKADASGNSIVLAAETVSGDVYGGQATLDLAAQGASAGDGTADRNSLSIAIKGAGSASSGSVYSGRVHAQNLAAGSVLSASGNTLSMTGGTYKDICGGYAGLDGDGTASASSNGARKAGSTEGGLLTSVAAESFSGGAAQAANGTAQASGNNFTLAGASFVTAAGGRAEVSGKGRAEASGNSLAVLGGNYAGAVFYAGYSSVSDAAGTAEASGNTLSLAACDAAMPKLDGAVLYGGFAAAGGDESRGKTEGNTLEFHGVQGLAAANVKNFDRFVFALPDMQAGDSILTLADAEGTSVSGASFDVQGIMGLSGADGGEFKVGDKVYLLVNSSGIEAEKASLKTVNYRVGSTLEYAMEVKADGGDGGRTTSVYLTSTGTSVLPGAKAIAEGAAAGLALANEAANECLGLARNFSPEEGVAAPFVYVQGSSVTHETGSSVRLNAVSLMAGVGAGVETGFGKLSAGAFFEYGKGSCTTSNSFDNASDVNGDGNSWYMGAGILARMEFLETGSGHFYVEGSAHMGQLHNEYDSSDLRDKYGRAAGFDMDSPYYSLHGGLGYVWNITEDHDLDVYGQHIWTRVDGTDETLTTGDKFEFDDMDSSRMRFGARYTYKGSERFRPYAGAAYEHEFAGSCGSKTFGHSVAAPSFESDTGIGELGIKMTPSRDLPLSIDLSVQGYAGQKQGVSGNCMVKYEF